MKRLHVIISEAVKLYSIHIYGFLHSTPLILPTFQWSFIPLHTIDYVYVGTLRGHSDCFSIALKVIDDLYSGDLDEETEEDRDTYRGVAAWLLATSVIIMIYQIIMLIIRILYISKVIEANFIVFGIIVSS